MFAQITGRSVAAAVALASFSFSIFATAEDDLRDGSSSFVSINEDRARTIWLQLAEEGDAYAQSALGFLYLIGLYVEQSDEEAAKWLGLAAQQGVADAQYYLGTMHLQGRGMRSSPDTAYFWCERAIKSGVTQLLQASYACSEEAARMLSKEEIRLITRHMNSR